MVYMVAPAANFQEAVICAWHWAPLGYKVIYLFDEKTLGNNDPEVLIQQNVLTDYVVVDQYNGWYKSVNFLMNYAVEKGADWVVCIGTDMDPENFKKADVIAEECTERFRGTYGIVQPTGDRWMEDREGLAGCERILGSPWVGKEYILKNKMVFFDEYFHYYGDEELLITARRENAVWQRRDISHLHRHPGREKRKQPEYLGKTVPVDRNLFLQRKKEGFPR